MTTKTNLVNLGANHLFAVVVLGHHHLKLAFMKTKTGNSTFNFETFTKDSPPLQYIPSFYKRFATSTI